jgi:hypothetical protein
MRVLFTITVLLAIAFAAGTSRAGAATLPPFTLLAKAGFPMPTGQPCDEPPLGEAVFGSRTTDVCWHVLPDASEKP